MDGTLVYGPFKAWADVLRAFEGGRLAHSPDPIFANYRDHDQPISGFSTCTYLILLGTAFVHLSL